MMAISRRQYHLPAGGVLLGRASVPRRAHPAVVTIRGQDVIEITSAVAPTVRDVCELAMPADHVGSASGTAIGSVGEIMENSFAGAHDRAMPRLLAPLDLQAVKAAGVTFVASLIERVIEEQARGAPGMANAIRKEVARLIGPNLARLKPGSQQALELKATLIANGLWSQYLEVGIGPDAEIFTKCQPMACVGFGADIGLLPTSDWNNPEPEVVVIASSQGRIVGATLGNDVNLRDLEGRSALLLGQAKDNNASAALGPFIRLFDRTFGLAEVQGAEVRLTVEGADGFHLQGVSSMAQISRSPEELVAATMGPHHQYPDGVALYLGTMFVPAKDRNEAGKGFTHKVGDIVTISTGCLGELVNRVQLTTACPPWTYGASHLLRDLAKANLI
jgi:fumarylacetoacetate (FAA) hydrolase family protein